MSKSFDIQVGSFVAFYSKKNRIAFQTAALKKGGALSGVALGSSKCKVLKDGELLLVGTPHDTSLIDLQLAPGREGLEVVEAIRGATVVLEVEE